MRETLSDWVAYLEYNGAALGLILTLLGSAMLTTGWRFERAAQLFIYAVVGLLTGHMLARNTESAYMIMAMGGASGAGIGLLLRNLAAPCLTGVVAAYAAWGVLGESAIPAPSLYIVLALIFVVIAAPALSNVRTATIVLTSFIGAGLIVSGIVGMMADSRSLAPHFRSMANYGVFYPFLLIVPTVSGIFIQLGAANRKDCGEVNI